MMAKFTVVGQFERGDISRAVPPEYRDLTRFLCEEGVRYTVVQFAHDRRAVVDSATVRRALASVASTDAIVAIGANFTAEALVLLGEREVRIARLGEFHWTDDSLHSLPR